MRIGPLFAEHFHSPFGLERFGVVLDETNGWPPMPSVPVRVEFLGEGVQVFKKRKRATLNGTKLSVWFAFNRVPTPVIGEVSPSGHGDPDGTVQSLVQLVDVGAEQIG